jgi:hypothetical protein
MLKFFVALFWFLAVLLGPLPQPVYASDCSRTSVGLIPLEDLGPDTYQGIQGGLYPGGQSTPPDPYLQTGIVAGRAIQPIDGKVALVSLGMSNASQVFSGFQSLANTHPQKHPSIVLVNGAQGGVTSDEWANPSHSAWTTVDQRVTSAGLTRSQVRAIWMLHGLYPSQWPSTPFPARARTVTESYLTKIVLNAEARYPNLQQIHLSDLNYLGYTTMRPYPEPQLGYESGFSIKWLIEDRITGATSGRSWLGWGGRLWTDGSTARQDGLRWLCADVQSDGAHLSTAGRNKAGAELLESYLTDPTTPWFRR